MLKLTTRRTSRRAQRGHFGIQETLGWRFAAKLCIAGAIMLAGLFLVIDSGIIATAAGVFLLGLVFAHALELQHETLHGVAFRGRLANEIAGICLGVPMLVSFADYQASHLRHHRDLGTDRNREFFDYGDQYGDQDRSDISRLSSIAVRFLMLTHYRQFAARLWLAVTGRSVPGESSARSRRIRRDHRVILLMLMLAVGLSVASHRPLVLTAWLLPLVLVACPVHALIELPEHYGCQTDTTDIFRNTRTVRTHPLVVWFVNTNNYHVEHHLKPRLPFSELSSLHRDVSSRSAYVADGYRGILRDLFGAMWKPGTYLQRRRADADVA